MGNLTRDEFATLIVDHISSCLPGDHRLALAALRLARQRLGPRPFLRSCPTIGQIVAVTFVGLGFGAAFTAGAFMGARATQSAVAGLEEGTLAASYTCRLGPDGEYGVIEKAPKTIPLDPTEGPMTAVVDEVNS